MNDRIERFSVILFAVWTSVRHGFGAKGWGQGKENAELANMRRRLLSYATMRNFKQKLFFAFVCN
ncbi:hypothetical protein [uncultured Desulfobacter sp.]|uniref:hypothetical protein n=1 Tax=uncultured Desulfobacter sp. TaxID=240139 RepID=UPI002AABAD96|nr:hypothetical protein [uncultured Desulfobacter sp.]